VSDAVLFTTQRDLFDHGWTPTRAAASAGDHRVHFEVDQILPRAHPSFEQRTVVARHHLITPGQIFADSAHDVLQTVRSQAAASTKSFVDGHRIAVAKGFNDHERHGGITATIRAHTTNGCRVIERR
jgi:hypothetical protein